MSASSGFNQDFLDVLRALVEAHAEFLIVGAHALAVHGVPRATGDLDIFVRPSTANAERVVAALHAFGAPLQAHGVLADDFSRPGVVYQIGLPPRRIDLLTSISGVTFDQAWDSRLSIDIDGMAIPFLGRDTLLANKRAAGRDKDLLDVKTLSARGDRER